MGQKGGRRANFIEQVVKEAICCQQKQIVWLWDQRRPGKQEGLTSGCCHAVHARGHDGTLTVMPYASPSLGCVLLPYPREYGVLNAYVRSGYAGAR